MAGMWKKVAVLGVVFIAIVSVLATQYGRIETKLVFKVQERYTYIGFMVRELNPNTTNSYLLTKPSGDAYTIDFGNFMPGTFKTYTAPFAIFNEERYWVNITGAELRVWETTYGGGAGEYTPPAGVHIWIFVHSSWGKTAAGRLVGNPVGAVASDREGTPGTYCLMLWEDKSAPINGVGNCRDNAPVDANFAGQGNTNTNPWYLGPGNSFNDPAGAPDGDYTLHGTTYNMYWQTLPTADIDAPNLWKADPSEPAQPATPGTRTNTDTAVWVEIAIWVEMDAAVTAQSQTCAIWFDFEQTANWL